ncbi:MAG: protein kinase [Acidobacteriota bacterium]
MTESLGRMQSADPPPLKVLVVDDDPQVLQFVRMAVSLAGHQVLATDESSRVHAIALEERPDVIVLDVMMPVSGFEILDALRGDPNTASIPILFLSGLGGGSDRVRGLRSGADDYLVKPFESDELILRIEKLGSRSGSGSVEDRGGDFGRYEVLEELGAGSMGTVYRGHDPRLERPVALKTIRLDVASTESRRRELLDLLRHEAVTIARLAHENIVAVYDMGETRDAAFIAMEYVDGASLSEYLKHRGPLTSERMIPLAVGIARGLATSHARNVIHRDVKPGNVLLGRRGAIKVSDFGLSHVVSSVSAESTELTGTPGYVPPEVLEYQPYTEAGDIFGLGATLYEALAGVHPLAGETLRETILNTVEGRIRPLDECVGDVPDELTELLAELLAVDPAARPNAEMATERLERMAFERQIRWSVDDLPARGASRST